jgi:molybdate transport system ATP-binding protein
LIDGIINGIMISDYADKKGALFSEITLNKFIDEEIRHGHFDVITSANNSLHKSSDGERKKALLKHLISTNPEYLILDNIFGSLDQISQKEIKNSLKELSKKIPIVQLTKRMNDILGFVNQIYQYSGKALVPVKNINTWNKKKKDSFIGFLPEAYQRIKIKSGSLVELKNVTVTYGSRTILNNISLTIKSGEFWQLSGPNGSGKTTILSLISGDNPKAYLQDITLFGIKKGSGESVWELKKNIGYFSSEMTRGFSRLDSIEKMIISGFFDSVGLYQAPKDRQIMLAHQWLELLGLLEIRKTNFLRLSTGHQRLVLIARAMVKHPPLLILDEPTASLDDSDALLVSDLINKIAEESNTAILYVSHRVEPGLNPSHLYELVPSENGSVGLRPNRF